MCKVSSSRPAGVQEKKHKDLGNIEERNREEIERKIEKNAEGAKRQCAAKSSFIRTVSK